MAYYLQNNNAVETLSKRYAINFILAKIVLSFVLPLLYVNINWSI